MDKEQIDKICTALYALTYRVDFLEGKLISVCAGCRDCGTGFAQDIANDLGKLMKELQDQFPDVTKKV
mgnify:CR=1 FL=1|tara:strand:- start:222 stop:425 length:204 start_codon:yes stop_codon:yes gene_type:complete